MKRLVSSSVSLRLLAFVKTRLKDDMPTPIGNYFMKMLINSPLHFLLGTSFAVITVTGRRSGKPITTPINVVRIDSELIVISMRNRTWWRNLRGGRTASLRHDGKRFPVRGEIVEAPAEVAAELISYFQQKPGYGKYFNIHIDPNGNPDASEMGRVAGECILVRLIQPSNLSPEIT